MIKSEVIFFIVKTPQLKFLFAILVVINTSLMLKIFGFSALLFSTTFLYAQLQHLSPPVADKKEHWRTVRGDSVLDNY
jgi:hypothetical protein